MKPTSQLLSLVALALATAAPGLSQDRFASVPDQVRPFVEKGDISGAVMLVANRDRILHLSAVGVSNLSTGRPMRTDDLFWIASMSKPMTATCIGMLVDDGKIRFDDPVEKYLPEFRGQWVLEESTPDRRVLVKADRPITIRDLLTHTSGLGEYPVTQPHWTLSEFVKVLARQPLRFQPGTRWAYSTAGIDTLGRIVEVVSGESFAAFMQERLFDPLGMKEATFWPTEAQFARLAQSYHKTSATDTLHPAVIDYMYGGAIVDRRRPALGGAGIFATAADVAKFYQMALNGGTLNGHRILRSETLAEMTREQTGDLRARPGMPWGYGFCVVEDPSKMVANNPVEPRYLRSRRGLRNQQLGRPQDRPDLRLHDPAESVPF